MMSNNTLTALERSYTNFLRRDLCFIAGGIVFLMSIIYAISKDYNVFTGTFDKIVQNGWSFIFGVLLAYLVGIIVHETLSNIPKLQKFLGTVSDIHEDYGLYMSNMEKIRKANEQEYITYERIVFFKEIGTKLGWSFFIGFLVTLVPFFIKSNEYSLAPKIIVSAVYIIFAFCCRHINKYNIEIEKQCYNKLVQNLSVNNKTISGEKQDNNGKAND